MHTVGVPDGGLKSHHRRSIREITGELKLRVEEASLVESVRRSDNHQVPNEDVVILT